MRKRCSALFCENAGIQYHVKKHLFCIGLSQNTYFCTGPFRTPISVLVISKSPIFIYIYIPFLIYLCFIAPFKNLFLINLFQNTYSCIGHFKNIYSIGLFRNTFFLTSEKCIFVTPVLY